MSSLLTNLDWRRPVPCWYDVGMSGYVDSSTFCGVDADSMPTGKENRNTSL